MGFPFGETVVLHSRSSDAQDGDGNDIAVYTDTTLTGAAVYPRAATGTASGVEVTDGRDLVSTGLAVVFNTPIMAKATDQVTVRGSRYDIDGEPNQLHSPLTGREVTQLALSKVTG